MLGEDMYVDESSEHDRGILILYVVQRIESFFMLVTSNGSWWFHKNETRIEAHSVRPLIQSLFSLALGIDDSYQFVTD